MSFEGVEFIRIFVVLLLPLLVLPFTRDYLYRGDCAFMTAAASLKDLIDYASRRFYACHYSSRCFSMDPLLGLTIGFKCFGREYYVIM